MKFCKALAGASLLSSPHISLWGGYTERRQLNLRCSLNKSTLKDVDPVLDTHLGKPLGQLAWGPLLHEGIIEYLRLEGAHKSHRVQRPAPHRATCQ